VNLLQTGDQVLWPLHHDLLGVGRIVGFDQNRPNVEWKHSMIGFSGLSSSERDQLVIAMSKRPIGEQAPRGELRLWRPDKETRQDLYTLSGRRITAALADVIDQPRLPWHAGQVRLRDPDLVEALSGYDVWRAGGTLEEVCPLEALALMSRDA